MGIKVENYLPEGYNAPCFVMITGDSGPVTNSDEETVDAELINGFGGNSDLGEDAPHSDRLIGGSEILFRFNQADKKLYTTNKYTFGLPITEDQVKELADYTVGHWSDGAGAEFQEAIMEQDDKEVFVEPWHSGQTVYAAIMPIEIPENHYWLGTIFDTPERMKAYEEFMNDEIVYRRFVKMCEVAKIDIPEDTPEESVALPIHKRDRNTGEILISAKVLKVFDQYQYAQNFLNQKEFPVGSAEHAIGKMMALSPKFCDFMMDLAKMQAEGKEIHDIEGNFNKASNEAMKTIETSKDLFVLYEEHWPNEE